MSHERLRHQWGELTAVAGENLWVIGSVDAWLGKCPPMLVCHGNGSTAKDFLQGWAWAPYFARQGFLVACADFGGPSNWGGPTSVTRMGQALDYLNAKGAAGPAVLFGGSMGALTALNFAKANPTRVKAVALTAPALNLTPFAAVPEVNTAYGGTYVPATHDPNYNPVTYGAGLPSKLPIKMWTASDDIDAPEANHAKPFFNVRPQTFWEKMGDAGGHTGVQTASAPSIFEWVRQFA